MSPARLVVPIDLGGAERACAIRPSLRPRPEPELIEALVAHYDGERRRLPEDLLEVAFFQGGVPRPDQLAAAGPHPLRLACSPADLLPGHLGPLVEAGLKTLELEVLTLDGGVLRTCRRGYTAAAALAMMAGLRAQGLRLGLTLMPGLPGSSHHSSLAELDQVLESPRSRPDFVRILPAVAFADTELATWAREGRWTPMTIGEAVTTCVAMVDRLEASGVEVARVGLQSRQDLGQEVEAGPSHPNLRGMVEVRRYRRRLERCLAHLPRGSRAIVSVHPKDLSWLKGTANENIRSVRAHLGLATLRIATDPSLPRGQVHLAQAS